MTTALTLRLVKGTPLTNSELDGNFTSLQTAIDSTISQITVAVNSAAAAVLSAQNAVDQLGNYGLLSGVNPFTKLGVVGTSSASAPLFKVVNSANPDPANLLGYSILSQDTGSLLANGNTQRPRLLQTSLSVGTGVTSTRIHENLFSSVYLTGAGTSGAEINQVHAYFENNATGPVTGDVEGFEASMLNNGTMNTYMSGLMSPRNGAAGIIAQMIGIKFQYGQDNTTAGAVTAVNHIDIEAKVGGGSVATTVNALRIADPQANIVTNGRMIIGSLAMPNDLDSFWIKGEDILDSTFAMRIQNSSGQDLLWVTNAGNVNIRQSIKLGSSGSLTGSIFFSNTTSGTIKLQAPNSGALGSPVLTLPAVTGTLATTKGTITNDDAAAGEIGEYISATRASGSPVSLITNTPANITSISLTAGDWDVQGSISFVPNPTLTNVSAWFGAISLVSATFPTLPATGAYFNQPTDSTGAAATFPTGTTRISLAATTTVYLVGQSTFTTSTQTAFGFISARRVR